MSGTQSTFGPERPTEDNTSPMVELKSRGPRDRFDIHYRVPRELGSLDYTEALKTGCEDAVSLYSRRSEGSAKRMSTQVSQVYRRVLQGGSEIVQTWGIPSTFGNAFKNAAIAAFDATLEHKRATRTAYLEREEKRRAAVPPTSTGAPSKADSTPKVNRDAREARRSQLILTLSHRSAIPFDFNPTPLFILSS